MRATKIALTAVGVLLLIVLVTVVALFSLDLGRAKNSIVELVSSYLDRDLAVETLSIELGRQVQVRATGVRLASTDWTEQPELLVIDDVALAIDLVSALEGAVIIESFNVGGARGYLAVAPNGDDNWTFAASSADDEPATPMVLRQARISDLELHYADPELPGIVLTASQLGITETDDGSLAFTISGALNDTPLAATGQVAPLANLIEGTDVAIAVTGDVGEIELEADGLIDDLTRPTRPAVKLVVRGPNAEYLTGVLGMDPVTSGPLDIAGSIDPSGETLQLRLDGTFGEFDVDLTGTVANLQSTDNVNLKLLASGPSAATVARLAGRDDFPALPFSVDAAASRAGEKVTVERLLIDLGAAKLNASALVPKFPGIENARARLTARGPEFGDFNRMLGLPGHLTGPFELTAELQQQPDSGATVAATLIARDISARLTGDLIEDPKLLGSTMRAEASGANLAVLTTALGYEGVPADAFGISADLAVIEDAVTISKGIATLGKVRLDFEGAVGIDPLSTHTHLSFGSRIEEPGKLLGSLGIEMARLPAGALTLVGKISRADGAFLLDDVLLSMATTEARVKGRIGDSFELADISLVLDVHCDNLAGVVPVEAGVIAERPFRVAGNLSFSQGPGGRDIFQLGNIQASAGDASARMELSMDLAAPLEAGSVTVDASGPSLTALLPMAADYLPPENAFSVRGSGQWQADVVDINPSSIELGEAVINLQGALYPPPDLARSAMTASARIPSLKNLQFLTDRPLPDQPLTASAVLSGTSTELRLTDLALSLGRSGLTGAGSFRPAGAPDDIPAFTVNVQSDYWDMRLFPPKTEPEPAARKADTRLIPDTPVPVELLARANGTFELNAREIELATTSVHDAQLKGNITDGVLTVDRFAIAGVRGSAVNGRLSIRPAAAGAASSAAVAQPVNLKLDLNGTDLVIGLPARTEEDRRLLPTYEIRSELAASGTTVRELAGTATGYLRLVGGEGQLNLAAVGLLARDFSAELLNAVNPFVKKEPLSRVQCFAVLVAAEDGQVVGQPAIVFQSDKLNIAGVGKVDLKTEKLNARFSTQARTGLGIGVSDLVSPLTEVGGTLANPTMQLNAKGALIEGGAAVATAGLSFLAKKARDRFFAKSDPCQQAIEAADAWLAKRESGQPN